MKKYFIILLMLLGLQGFSQSKLYLQNKKTSELVHIKLNTKIHYSLHSDSVLELEHENFDRDFVQWVSDSSFFFPSGEEVLFSDVKTIKFYKPFHNFMRKLSAPLICAGAPFLLRGVTKFQLEGMERDNANYVPLAVASGGFVTLLGTLPLLIPPKSYDLSNGEWELISMQ